MLNMYRAVFRKGTNDLKFIATFICSFYVNKDTPLSQELYITNTNITTLRNLSTHWLLAALKACVPWGGLLAVLKHQTALVLAPRPPPLLGPPLPAPFSRPPRPVVVCCRQHPQQEHCRQTPHCRHLEAMGCEARTKFTATNLRFNHL